MSERDDLLKERSRLRESNANLLLALNDSMVALDDWLHTYASEERDAQKVQETRAHVAKVQVRNRAAIKEAKLRRGND